MSIVDVKADDDDYEEDEDYAPTPSSPPRPIGKTDIESCKKKFSKNCGDQIFNYIFKNDKKFDGNCCDELMAAGKVCHFNLIDDVLKKSPEFKGKEGYIFNRRGEASFCLFWFLID
ncbi:hypothetical protein ACFE04_008159 [Oxalis oulophora]